MFEYDTKYVYLALPDAQKFFNMPGEVTGVELKVADPDTTEATLAQLQRIAGSGYEVRDWKMINRSLFSALKIEKILMFVLLCFGILVAAFSIICNGWMLVQEKGKEVAILKSMGASDRTVLIGSWDGYIRHFNPSAAGRSDASASRSTPTSITSPRYR